MAVTTVPVYQGNTLLEPTGLPEQAERVLYADVGRAIGGENEPPFDHEMICSLVWHEGPAHGLHAL